MQETWKKVLAGALLALLPAACSQDVRQQELSREILKNQEDLARLEAQLPDDEKALLDKYLQRARQADDVDSFFEGLTVGEAVQRQRMYEQEAQMRAMEDPAQQEREAALERLRAVVSVRALSKQFAGGKNVLHLEIANLSQTAVTGIEGVVQPRDKVGYWFPKIELCDDELLAPGERRVVEKTLDFDLANTVTFQHASFDELIFDWLPERVTLADGSVMEAAARSSPQ